MKLDKFRANLKSRIKEMGFTQQEFADIIGISNAALKKYMSNGINTSLPDIETFDNMCTALDCDYDYLMGKIDAPRKYISDIKEVTGLSNKAITTLKEIYDNTKPYKPLPYPFNLDNDDTMQKVNNVIINMNKNTLKAIDFLLSNEDAQDSYNLLMNIGMYLFGDYGFSHKNVKLVDENNSTIMLCDPEMAKTYSLNSITYQLQTWRNEIKKFKRSENL